MDLGFLKGASENVLVHACQMQLHDCMHSAEYNDIIKPVDCHWTKPKGCFCQP